MKQPNCNKKERTSEQGFTLLELLITIIIGMFITLASMTFLTNTVASYNRQDMIARIQENARFAVQLMSHDLRQAGFYGCSLKPPIDARPSIVGINNENNGISDVLTVRFADSSAGVYDVQSDDARTDTLVLLEAGTQTQATETAFRPGDEILISDCGNSEIAKIATVNGATLKLSGALDNTFNDITQVRLISDHTYAIRPATDDAPSVLTRTRPESVANPAVGTPVVEPLVQGVDYMRVLYGTDTDNDGAPNSYAPWSDSIDITQVVALKVGLLLRSVSNHRLSEDGQYGLDKDASDFELLDLDRTQIGLPKTDRVSRRIFVSNIQIRNTIAN